MGHGLWIEGWMDKRPSHSLSRAGERKSERAGAKAAFHIQPIRQDGLCKQRYHGVGEKEKKGRRGKGSLTQGLPLGTARKRVSLDGKVGGGRGRRPQAAAGSFCTPPPSPDHSALEKSLLLMKVKARTLGRSCESRFS